MTKPLTLAQLKKSLADLDSKQLTDLICTLYKENDPAKKMLNLRFQDPSYEETLFEEYKEKMDKIIHPRRGPLDVDFKAGALRSLISEFKKLHPSIQNILKLQMFFVSGALEFTIEYGDIDEPFYDSLCSMYETVATTLKKQNDLKLFQYFQPELEEDIQIARNFGWGVEDYLEEVYQDLFNHFS